MRDRDWMALIKLGAPPDEYDSIAETIYCVIDKEDSISIANKKIWDIFYQDFCVWESYRIEVEDYDTTKQYCFGTRWATNEEAIRLIGSVESFRDLSSKILDIIKS